MLRKNSGFTLVELLIVVAIIGILAAIAIPQFAAYRAKAYCSAAKSDLANLAIAQEAYFTDYTAYSSGTASTTAAGVATPLTLGASKFTASTGVTVVTVGTTSTFTATATHASCLQGSTGGTAGTYTWDAAAGGLTP
jgi:prepilin-type N-terminal cleavage/methylation domain-containing protein